MTQPPIRVGVYDSTIDRAHSGRSHDDLIFTSMNASRRTQFTQWAIVAIGIFGCATDRHANAQGRRDASQSPPQQAQPDIATPRIATPTAITRASYDEALRYLWPATPPAMDSCRSESDPVRCLIERRWSAWTDARAVVEALWSDFGIVCGVERAAVFDAAYRGRVEITPEFPVGRWAQQLAWVDGALRDQDSFYRSIASRAAHPIAYRWTGLGILFHRTVNTRTPAAYAAGWTVAYNVNGALNHSRDTIMSTVIHEVFHLNDAAHEHWSSRVLQPIYERIQGRCHENVHCLSPYAPTPLRVRRTGMYYAFQRGNSDVGEYAAVLAERYFLELSHRWRGTPFKCENADNAASWQSLVDEFFGGYDGAITCGNTRGHSG